MAVKEPTQKNKLKLAAREIPFSDDHAGQYYLQPRVQKCLTLEDIAAEVAALSARQEDAEDVGRILRQAVRRIMWFVSSGYSVSTELGSFRLTAQGVFAQGELGGVPDRDRLRLGVSYTMSEAMRDLLDQVEIDVEIQSSDSQPRICGVVSTEDLQRPAEALRVLEGLRDYNPGYPVYLAAARICDRRGEWEKSLEYFAKAEKDSMTYQDFVTYALNCELMREYQQGLDAALLGLEQYPDSAALNRLAMRQLVILDKYADALVYVDRLFNKSENAKIGWQDYNYAGRAFYGAKRYSEAIGMFSKITADDELKPVERSTLVDYTARAYANLGDYDKAITMYSDFVAKQERDSLLSAGDVYNLANMYMRKAQDSTTVNPTEAWLKADSTFAVMASRFTANADFALANRLQIAYVLDPDFKTGRCVPIAEQLVAVVTAKGEADDASTARLLNAYRFLAFHYTINKNRKRSRMYWQKVLELDPDNETAKNVLGIKG